MAVGAQAKNEDRRPLTILQAISEPGQNAEQGETGEKRHGMM